MPKVVEGAIKSRYFRGMKYDGDESFSYYVDDMIKSSNWSSEDRRRLPTIVAECTSDEGVVDWEAVADSYKKYKTPIECFMRYRNELDPTINKCTWSDEENRRLVELARIYDEHDWVTIAHELGTSRTPMQCIQQYQQCNNVNLINKDEFSPEEIETLRDAVATYGDHNWQHVANSLPGRSSKQCIYSWRKIRDSEYKKGHWSDDEVKRLFFGGIALQAPTNADTTKSQEEIKAFDSANDEEALAMLLKVELTKSTVKKLRRKQNQEVDVKELPETVEANEAYVVKIWRQVSAIVGSRDELQIREKWCRDIDPTVYKGEWDAAEKVRFERILRLNGPGPWAMYARWFPGRSDEVIFNWWKALSSKSCVLLNWN